MRSRRVLLTVLLIVVAVVLQTTLFGRFRVITPDLVMLLMIVLALTRMRPEAVLGVAFASGVIIDLLGSSLLGLRGIVFTAVAFIAVRTRERAEIGRIATALWAGLLTFAGIVLLVLIGTLFGESSLLSEHVRSRVFLVPLANMAVAALVAPTIVRWVNGDRTSLRYA
jgi:rod shape-determining protein MreD